MGSARRHSASRRILGLGAAAFVASSALGTATIAAVASTSSVLASAKAAILEQTGVHLVLSVPSGSSSSAEKVTEDVATKIGAETIMVGKATATVRVTSTDAYLSGNSSGLTTFFGLSATQAKKVGKDWVTMKAGTSQYSDLESGVTISSITGLLPPAKGTKLSSHVVDGTKLFVLTWTTAATSSTPRLSSTLTISAVGATLPVEETATAPTGKETITLSKWDEHVVVSAPPAGSTIAYSKVTG